MFYKETLLGIHAIFRDDFSPGTTTPIFRDMTPDTTTLDYAARNASKSNTVRLVILMFFVVSDYKHVSPMTFLFI